MTAEYFAHLYEYDIAENRKVLAHLQTLQEVDDRTRSVFAHLLQAKRLWLWRMRGDNYKGLVIWPEFSWDECEQLIGENETGWSAFLAGLSDEDLLRSVAFQDSLGVGYEMPVRDILSHVLFHGSYHRGQIAAAVRAAGSEPVRTDYILYARNGGK